MWLGDVTEAGGPHDPFKVGREKKLGEKPQPEKITQVNHWDNNKLNSISELKKEFVPKVTWSEAQDKFTGYERLFSKVISQAKLYEADDLRRE